MYKKRIAVVGCGISSMTFLLSLLKKLKVTESHLLKPKNIHIDIFEPSNFFQGRTKSLKKLNDLSLTADIGANFLDFETQQEKNYLQKQLPEKFLNKFIPFQGKFMLFKDNQLQDSEYIKQRYFYQNGFERMAYDWLKEIKAQMKDNLKLHKLQVEKADLNKYGKWRVNFKSSQKLLNQLEYCDQFDYLVLGCPADISYNILSHDKYFEQLSNQLKKVRYSEQISAVFYLEKRESTTKIKQDPYSILFLDHQLTFICFQSQKYPSNDKEVIVVQMNEQFTKKYSKCFNTQGRIKSKQFEQKIGQQIFDRLPQQIKERYNIQQQCVALYYWDKALIKPNRQVKNWEEYHSLFNQKLNITSFNDRHKNLYFVGDFINNKSRVTSAMKIGAKTAEKLYGNQLRNSLNRPKI